MRMRTVASVMFGIAILTGCDPGDDEFRSGNPDYEVWLVDQSNSFGKTHGGTVYIYDGDDLQSNHAENAEPDDVILLDCGATELCVASTGVEPVRPHMMVFNETDSHGILSFVASGHVVIFDAPTRRPLSCFRTEAGAGGVRQAHAAFPTAGDDFVVVANQNGKKLERINTTYGTDTFTQDAPATIDLASCTTPSGAPCQAAGVRPDNAPICPIPLPNGQVVVTLRGGGMFVVDPSTSPMSIVAEYDMDHVIGNGCGGTVIGDQLFITSGGGTASNLYAYDVYSFPINGFSAANPPNSPAPAIVDHDDSDNRDAHGVTPVKSKNSKYLWVADRGLGLISTYKVSNFDLENEIQIGGDFDEADKLTPDLLQISPNGSRVFGSLRGPVPLSGDAHVAVGSQPGMVVLKPTGNGKDGHVEAIIPISNIDAMGVERADAHAIQVRTK